jgi:MFS family permease
LAGHNVAETADAAPSSWFSWIGLGAGLAFSVGTARSALRAEPDVRQLDLASLRTAEGRRRLLGWTIAGLVVGAALGVTVYLLFALPAAPGAGGLLGLLTGLVAGLMSGLGAAPVTAGRPSETFARGTAYDLATMLIVGTAFGFTVGPWFGPAFGVAFGLACAALRRAGSPWPRYALAAWLNARAGFMPPRPAPFLDWAYHAGLVRLSGAAVQFRHHDLQLWLLATMADGDLISTPGAGGRPCASSSADR